MNEYKSEVIRASKELSSIEKVRLTDATGLTGLDKICKKGESVAITVDYYAIIHVVNPSAKTDSGKDYTSLVIYDTEGNGYKTSSDAFISRFETYMDAATDDGIANPTIFCTKGESVNYESGFLTCRM